MKSNAAGGVNGMMIKPILEDGASDPKKLTTRKQVNWSSEIEFQLSLIVYFCEPKSGTTCL